MKQQNITSLERDKIIEIRMLSEVAKDIPQKRNLLESKLKEFEVQQKSDV